MKGASFWAALLAPICVVLAINTLLFIRICREILRERSSGGQQYKDICRQFLVALSIAFLLGLSWLLGLIALDNDSPIAFQYVFAILQMLTGLSLLLFHVLMRKEIREEWYKLLRQKIGEPFTTSTTNSSIRSRRTMRSFVTGKSANSSHNLGEKFSSSPTDASGSTSLPNGHSGHDPVQKVVSIRTVASDHSDSGFSDTCAERKALDCKPPYEEHAV